MTVFICAMACEFDAVIAAFDQAVESDLLGRRVATGLWRNAPAAAIHCGIGKVNAALAVQLAADRLEATCVISAGVAGGLRTTMEPGEVYAVRAAVQYDFDLSKIDGTTVGKLEEFPSHELPFSPFGDLPAELLATGDRFSDGEEDYPLLIDGLDAGLRDMEGAAVAHAALRAGLDVMGVKAVTNVRGHGSMHAQYARNRARALTRLTEALRRA